MPVSIQLNLEDMKNRPCLSCGKKMYTDRSHRICSQCKSNSRKIGRSGSPRRVHLNKPTIPYHPIDPLVSLDAPDKY